MAKYPLPPENICKQLQANPSVQETLFELAKKRLSDAAARLLAGDRSAIKEADETMAETQRLRRETQINHVTQGSFKGGSRVVQPNAQMNGCFNPQFVERN